MNTLRIDGNSLTLEMAMSVAEKGVQVELAEEARPRMQASRDLVEKWVRDNKVMYGITTGFGEFSNVHIGTDKLEELQRNLIISHAVGCGDPIPKSITRLLMLLRANALNLIARLKPGSEVRIAGMRGDQRVERTITVVARPD